MRFCKSWRLLSLLVFILQIVSFTLRISSSEAQEKKLLRVVFVSLSWNSEIPNPAKTLDSRFHGNDVPSAVG